MFGSDWKEDNGVGYDTSLMHRGDEEELMKWMEEPQIRHFSDDEYDADEAYEPMRHFSD